MLLLGVMQIGEGEEMKDKIRELDSYEVDLMLHKALGLAYYVLRGKPVDKKLLPIFDGILVQQDMLKRHEDSIKRLI